MAKNQAQFEDLVQRIRTNTLTPQDTDTNGVLNLNNKGLTATDAKALATALKHNTTLTELKLMCCKIGPPGAKALATALKHNATLEVLDLRDDKIGDKGAKALADALEHNTTLTRLYLNDKNISQTLRNRINGYLWRNYKPGLLKGIRTNTLTLKDTTGTNSILYLSQWPLTLTDIEALAKALHHNTTLRGLNLDNKDMVNEGLVHLVQALRHNTTLTRLSLRNTSLGDEGVLQLELVLLHNTGLTQLDLKHNTISPTAQRILAAAVLRNHTLTQLEFTFTDADTQRKVTLHLAHNKANLTPRRKRSRGF